MRSPTAAPFLTEYHLRWLLSVRKPKNIGLLEGKVPMFCLESTEVCLKEVRCFWVSEASPPKKVLRFSPTFPTPIFEIPFIYWGFRVKDGV